MLRTEEAVKMFIKDDKIILYLYFKKNLFKKKMNTSYYASYVI